MLFTYNNAVGMYVYVLIYMGRCGGSIISRNLCWFYKFSLELEWVAAAESLVSPGEIEIKTAP